MLKKVKLINKIIVCLAFFSLIPSIALADGMIIRPDPNSDRYDYADESDQQAFINYEQGLQKMILSISLEKQDDQDLVWIFPVPAEPQKVVIDIIDKLPNFSGQDISKKAKSNLQKNRNFLTGTQIYPTIIQNLFIRSSSVRYESANVDYGLSAGVASMAPETKDVVVYETLEKQGLTTEILTAKTAAGLDDYFKSKGLKITTSSLPVLSDYIGQDYTFIASWITKQTTVVNNPIIPIVTGTNETTQQFAFVTLMMDWIKKPAAYPEISKLASTYTTENPQLAQAIEYDRLNNKAQNSREQVFFFKLNQFSDLLNKFKLDIQSNPIIMKQYQQLVPTRTTVVNPVSPRPQKLQKGLFVIFPTDKIYFPLKPTSVYGSKEIPISVRVIGLVNPKLFGTLSSYATTTYFDNNYLPTNKKDTLAMFYGQTQDKTYTKIDITVPSKYLTDDLLISRYLALKAIAPLFISRHPIILTLILLVILSFLLSAFWGWLIFGHQKNKILFFGLWGLFNLLSIIGLVIATIFLKTRPIKPEDAELFAELKRRGYSAPNYRYRDIRKLYYLAAFSLSFTLLGWGIPKLLEFIM